MDEEFFTCKYCGYRELIVKEYYKVAKSLIETQKCKCGRSENGLAYQSNYTLYIPGVDFYRLGYDHRFDESAGEFYEDVEEPHMGDLRVNIYCRNCYDPHGDFEIQENDPLDIEVGDVEFYVVCANCGREIEFGWTYLGRDVFIWPVECNDFDPWNCTPDPKYRDKWLRRGWLSSIEQ
ncbi:MAG: hypothetical protein ACLFVI_03065 [Archaeoglobaceae archaeon]